ncbi:glycosyltransferase family 2 protein [Arthrobacter mobilis]|uniref:Glycosyltransferase family 2 protein n=1 Tax=Arthrobacter mobilis TaxID=2724944 RepID=A0A7X6K5F1_9MICC|nr:glycosyltransferase family 2 protein [Arthrobacter mobilis]NKX54129.1 glycosyltransferase family 2 protein [Arthrobacter mobilis]
MSRRWSGDWARPLPEPEPAEVDVLIPCYGRPAELAVALAGLAAQDAPGFRVVLSDQTEPEPVWEDPAVAAMVRVLRCQGRPVQLEHHLPRRGMAEQRHYLLSLASAPLVLYLDSDVWLEPDMLHRMVSAIRQARCGFIGAAVQGLSYLPDERPDEQRPFELWDGPVLPERVRRDSPGFGRWTLHNAANLAHLARDLQIPPGGWRLYKVAWVGGCVLYDRQALLDCGGFGFWHRLPPGHAGEDMAAEWQVMEKYGGAGMIPSGAVHLESPTTVPDRRVEAADVVLDS